MNIIPGMTGAEVRAALNTQLKIVDVRDAGCYGDGSHDDTANFQAAINEANTNVGGVVYAPKGEYIIDGPLLHDVGGVDYNSQLYIPWRISNDQRTTVKILGEFMPNFLQTAGIGTVTPPRTGTILRSTIASDTPGSAIIGTKALSGYLYNNFNNIGVENIQLQYTPDGDNKATIGGLNFSRGSSAKIRNVTVFPIYGFNLNDIAEPTNECIGINMPGINCETMNIVESCMAGGLTSGYKTGDHTYLNNAQSFACVNGFEIGYGLNMATIAKGLVHYCKNIIYFSGGTSIINVLSLSYEGPDQEKWYDYATAVLDSNNYGNGTIRYHFTAGANTWTKTGGAYLRTMPIFIPTATGLTITGSKGGNAALASLITKMCLVLGLTDGTT